MSRSSLEEPFSVEFESICEERRARRPSAPLCSRSMVCVVTSSLLLHAYSGLSASCDCRVMMVRRDLLVVSGIAIIYRA